MVHVKLFHIICLPMLINVVQTAERVYSANHVYSESADS